MWQCYRNCFSRSDCRYANFNTDRKTRLFKCFEFQFVLRWDALTHMSFCQAILSNWVQSFSAKLLRKWDTVNKKIPFNYYTLIRIRCVTRSLGTSLIERLMKSNPYQRNAKTKAFCSRMLTQLLQNFRSHPDIINISNDLFYDGELVPSAPIAKTHRFLGWSKLPVKHVPIIFDAMVGTARQEGKSKR